jgi:hypothetical protein
MSIFFLFFVPEKALFRSRIHIEQASLTPNQDSPFTVNADRYTLLDTVQTKLGRLYVCLVPFALIFSRKRISILTSGTFFRFNFVTFLYFSPALSRKLSLP